MPSFIPTQPNTSIYNFCMTEYKCADKTTDNVYQDSFPVGDFHPIHSVSYSLAANGFSAFFAAIYVSLSHPHETGSGEPSFQ